MADNVTVTAGSGTTIAADDIAGVLHQRVKISQGADGVATDVSSAAPLQVTLANTGANATPVKTDGSATTQPVSGTVTVNALTNSSVVKAQLQDDAGTAVTVGQKAMSASLPVVISSDQSAVPVSLPSVNFVDVMVTGQGSQTALNNNVILSTAGATSYDTLGTTGIAYRSISIQIVPAAGTVTAGVISFEGSNDNTNFSPFFLVDEANITAVPVSLYTIVASTSRYFKGPLVWRYIRARISTGVTGTTTGVQAFSRLSTTSFTDTRLTVTQTTSTSLGVSAAVASVVPGVAATNLGKTEDAVHTSGDVGVMALAVSNVAQTVLNSADGDYTPIAVDTRGNTLVTGNVAHDAVDSGAPVKTGGRAVSAEITPVTANDRVDSIYDLVGKQIILPYANPENFVSGAITTPMTLVASTSLVAAPGAGLRNYITTIIVSNAHATVGTDVIIQDGTGGTTLMTIPAASVYGGGVVTLPVPLRQPTTNTALFCANVTTGASTKVSAFGYKGA